MASPHSNQEKTSGRQLYSADSIINKSVDDYYEDDDGFDNEPDYEVNSRMQDNRGDYPNQFAKDNPKLLIGRVTTKDNTIIVKQFSSESRKEMIEKRIEMNYSQSDFATRTFIPINKLKQIELGMIKPSHKELKAINKELDLKLYFV